MDNWSVYGWLMINQESFKHNKNNGELNFFSYKDEDTRHSIRLMYKGDSMKAYLKDVAIADIVCIFFTYFYKVYFIFQVFSIYPWSIVVDLIAL